MARNFAGAIFALVLINMIIGAAEERALQLLKCFLETINALTI